MVIKFVGDTKIVEMVNDEDRAVRQNDLDG